MECYDCGQTLKRPHSVYIKGGFAQLHERINRQSIVNVQSPNIVVYIIIEIIYIAPIVTNND